MRAPGELIFVAAVVGMALALFFVLSYVIPVPS